MTKTQIHAVAAAIKSLRMNAPTPAEQIGISVCARAVALAIEQTRQGFDPRQFLRDCGVTP